MLVSQVLFSLSLLSVSHSNLQINLHRTHSVNENNRNFQYHCLQVPASMIEESDPRQIISYCLGQWPLNFSIKENKRDQKFTFKQLAKQNITNQQLYHWSAPIDLIEQYQFYLNQLKTSEQSSLESEIFYNCTLPYFGLQCEYVLEDHQSYHLSLDEIVHDYYRYNRYQPTLLTCYVHLECNRGPSPSCLDWREICDGKIDCLDDGLDEEHCWQMEVQPYEANEDSLINQGCISERYFRDDSNIRGCVGESTASIDIDRLVIDPRFEEEDISCTKYNNIKHKVYSIENLCTGIRIDLLSHAMFSIKPIWLTDECWSILRCIFKTTNTINPLNALICPSEVVHKMIKKVCPDLIVMPAFPVLLGHIYAAYSKDILLKEDSYYSLSPTYFCYNENLLHIPENMNKTISYNNSICRSYYFRTPSSMLRLSSWFRRHITSLYFWLRINAIIIDKKIQLLDQSMTYQCNNWPKKISKSQLFDGVIDCPGEDDENVWNQMCSAEQNKNIFICPTTDQCIPQNLLNDGICHCNQGTMNLCEDERSDVLYSITTLSFQTICDGYSNLLPKFMKIDNETDETNCEYWPSIHIYNHCDGFWNNLNGSDEVNCDPSPLLNCSINDHICVSSETNELICLSMNKINDGIIDCLGAADEPTLCRGSLDEIYPLTYYCHQNASTECAAAREICDNNIYCPNNEDEIFCKPKDFLGTTLYNGICKQNYESDGSDKAKIICRRFHYVYPKYQVYFTLDQWLDSIKRYSKQENILSQQSPRQNIQSYQPRCHRGLNLQIWLDKQTNHTKNICLCPPSYYGDQCQYQNQRLSLSLLFQVASDSLQTPFAIIVYLLEDTDERIIHSSEQFTYLAVENCRRRFDVYLLYSDRPKDETKDYLIQIDVYEKETLNYRASFIKSLNFTFLPVHRVILQISIPHAMNNEDECSDDQCEHGKCRKYYNDRNNRTFCQCGKEWSGRFCHIHYHSMCSSDSLPFGKLSNNRSLCVCPENKIGPRCLINDDICQKTTCLNGGKCILVDEYQTGRKRFLCICPQGYTGDRCETSRTQLILLFDKNINLPSVILIHFIEVRLDAAPIRTTTFKTIPFDRNEVIIYWSLPFHMVFIEFSNYIYYLAYVNKIYNQTTVITTILRSSDRCLNISELFNETLVNSFLLHRIKFYHIPCQTRAPQLKCFYDEIHLCLCQQIKEKYVTNCFEFDHNTSLYCSGQNGCLNDGQCFEEQSSCPRISICKCPPCFYGSQCQLTSTGFSLSLDAIFGFHIRPNVGITQQPFPVLISLILTVIITILGFVNGILTLMTFQNKITHESGCGFYLLGSSIVVISTMIVVLLKFVILLLSQMGTIKNILFLKIQCHSIDFLFRFCLTMDQWLTSFVAIERASTIIKRTNFNKTKSKLIAKYIIGILIFIAVLTNVHDPIYRSLFEEINNDDDVKRIWCIVNYPPIFRMFNVVINIFHFIITFIINIISALVIIIMSTRQQILIKKKKKHREIFNEQIQKHRHLLIGPCALIILAIPRLIISFASGCMKSAGDSWLFLLGYFISLIPSLLTFLLFVLPSTTYKKAFQQVLNRYRHIIQRHL